MKFAFIRTAQIYRTLSSCPAAAVPQPLGTELLMKPSLTCVLKLEQSRYKPFPTPLFSEGMKVATPAKAHHADWKSAEQWFSPKFISRS